MKLIFTTSKGIEISVSPGNKSEYDFIVRFQEPGKRKRTLKHNDVIQDMRVKLEIKRELTLKLKDEIINLLDSVKSISYYPPKVSKFSMYKAKKYSALKNIGDYSPEFLLVMLELIFIQEKINYPDGYLTREVYSEFGVKDHFTVLGKVTRR